MRGKFVTIEGCEGVGKSTQVRLLGEYCAAHGVDAVFTREPGGTPIAEKIRAIILDPENAALDPQTELLLYAASRRQHTAEKIEPALAAGKTVFCDRYIDSTRAYQGYARGLKFADVDALETMAMGDTRIDVTLFLDVDPATGFARKGGADAGDRMEREDAAFFQKVYRGFCDIAARHPDRVVRIDASGSKQQTHAAILAALVAHGIL